MELFHVKHPLAGREGLLTYTELPEDDVQNVLDIHAAQEPPQGMSRHPQFFRRQLLALPDHLRRSAAARPPSPAASLRWRVRPIRPPSLPPK